MHQGITCENIFQMERTPQHADMAPFNLDSEKFLHFPCADQNSVLCPNFPCFFLFFLDQLELYVLVYDYHLLPDPY